MENIYRAQNHRLATFLIISSLCAIFLAACDPDSKAPALSSCAQIKKTQKPADKQELTYLINASSDASDLNFIDTSLITDMSDLFASKAKFNAQIHCWDTSNVTNMAHMFNSALAFNQDIGSWDVSNVTDMTQMFSNAFTFNQDIRRWNTGKVTKMNRMFLDAAAFNQNIGGWDTSNVTDMQQMFNNAMKFDQDLSKWDVRQVRFSNPNEQQMVFNSTPMMRKKNQHPKWN